MNWALVAFVTLYQRLVCGCVAEASCCRQGLAAARTLPFWAAAAELRAISERCWHEHPAR